MTTVQFIFSAILFTCIQFSVLAAEIHDQLYAKDVSIADGIITEDVLFEFKAPSRLACARQCKEREECQSFTFIPGPTKTSPGFCRGNGPVWSPLLSEQWVSASGARTYRRVHTTDRSDWLYRPCAENYYCEDGNIECYRGRCLCTPGYYYSVSSKTCVASCNASDLQSTYILYPGSGIAGNNDYVEVTSVGGCKQACTAIPTCLNFEKTVSLISICQMAEVTALDEPYNFNNSDDSWNLYQRNCA